MKTLETEIAKRKARFVAKELAGERGKKTYVPMVREETAKILLACAFQNDLTIVGGDMESAFLHGKHKHKTLLRMLRGLKQCNKDGEELLCWLVGNLHGTTTASWRSIHHSKDENVHRSRIHTIQE